MQIRFQDEVTPIIQRKLTHQVDQEDINLAIMEADLMIQEYCNIDTTPLQLVFTLTNIAVDILEAEYIKAEAREEVVTSISQGDTSINFANQQHKIVKKEDIPKNYAKTLNRYRKLRK